MQIFAGKCSPTFVNCTERRALEHTCPASFVYSYDYDDCVPYSWIPGCVSYESVDAKSADSSYFTLKWPGGLLAQGQSAGGADDAAQGEPVAPVFFDADAFGFVTCQAKCCHCLLQLPDGRRGHVRHAVPRLQPDVDAAAGRQQPVVRLPADGVHARPGAPVARADPHAVGRADGEEEQAAVILTVHRLHFVDSLHFS